MNVFCRSETLGDGNCFYRAVVEQIRDRTDIGDVSNLKAQFSHHDTLRRAFVEFVRSQSLLPEVPYYIKHYYPSKRADSDPNASKLGRYL